MNNEFFEALELLNKQKGIPTEYMIERVEAALMSAYKRELGTSSGNVRVHIDPVKRDVKVYQQKSVVEEVNDVAELVVSKPIFISKEQRRKKCFNNGDELLQVYSTHFLSTEREE